MITVIELNEFFFGVRETSDCLVVCSICKYTNNNSNDLSVITGSHEPLWLVVLVILVIYVLIYIILVILVIFVLIYIILAILVIYVLIYINLNYTCNLLHM
jgi:Flp pilus assembly protein TadB